MTAGLGDHSPRCNAGVSSLVLLKSSKAPWPARSGPMHAAGPQSKRQCVFCAAVYCLQTALGTVRVWRFSAKCDIINSPTYRRPDCDDVARGGRGGGAQAATNLSQTRPSTVGRGLLTLRAPVCKQNGVMRTGEIQGTSSKVQVGSFSGQRPKHGSCRRPKALSTLALQREASAVRTGKIRCR